MRTHWANHGLEPSICFNRSVKARIPNQKGDVMLVDTPGYDASGTAPRPEAALEAIADWLQRRLVSMVYLY